MSASGQALPNQPGCACARQSDLTGSAAFEFLNVVRDELVMDHSTGGGAAGLRHPVPSSPIPQSSAPCFGRYGPHNPQFQVNPRQVVSRRADFAETAVLGADMDAACRLLGTDTVLAMARAPGLLDRGACDWRVVLLTLGMLQVELGLPQAQVVAATYDWILRDPDTTHRPVADVCNISKNVRWLRRCACLRDCLCIPHAPPAAVPVL